MDPEIILREIELMDFFRTGHFKETDKDAFTGDSVFVRMDTSFQGFMNHLYQRSCLFLSLFLRKSPINYEASVAEMGGKIVGVCWVRRPSNLVGIFVHPDYRRRGIGSSLVKHFVEHVKGEMVVIHNENNPSVNLFKKHGFKIESKFCKLVRN